MLEAAGLKEDAERPQLLIVNTCAVTAEAQAKSRKAVRRLVRRLRPEQVMVIGCAAELLKEELEIDAQFLPHKQKLEYMEKLKNTAGKEFSLASGRSRAFLKIQDGCNQACSYCIVPSLRGPEVSYPADEIMRRLKKLEAVGYREVVLTGVHLGRYRYDGLNLASLLRQAAASFSGRIRLSSIDVFEIDDELIDTLVELRGKVCPHLHIPLQSGSDRILRLMRRPYTSSGFLETVEKIRSKFTKVALSTDVMVGFPGETDKDFEATVEVVGKAGFMRLHVFRFSSRPGTPAAEMEQTVEHRVIEEREHRLIELGKKLEEEFMKSLEGEELQVLVERAGRGRSEYYVEVEVPRSLERGKIYHIRARYEDGKLKGEVLE